MTQEINNDWDPESNPQELDGPIFSQESIDNARGWSVAGVVNPSGISGYSNQPGYAYWTTATYSTQYNTTGGNNITSMWIDEASPYTPTSEYTYHSASWKDTLAASLFLIRQAFKIIWKKYLNAPIGVKLICRL